MVDAALDRPVLRRVAVFCGSRPGVDPRIAEATARLGRLLAARGLGLVYGGGDVGLMGLLADTVLEHGGEVIGVIPRLLEEREVAHHGLHQLILVDTMHERKRAIYGLAEAVVALPGGIGTFEELFEALTWNQLGIHSLPCGVLDVGGYYQHLLAMLDHAVAQGFLPAGQRALLAADDDPSSLLDRLAKAVAAGTTRAADA